MVHLRHSKRSATRGKAPSCVCYPLSELALPLRNSRDRGSLRCWPACSGPSPNSGPLLFRVAGFFSFCRRKRSRNWALTVSVPTKLNGNMEKQNSGILQARLVAIEKLSAYQDDPTDDRLIELEEAIERWHRAVREGRN